MRRWWLGLLGLGLAANLLLVADALTVGLIVPLAAAQGTAAAAPHTEAAETGHGAEGATAACLEAETTYRNLVRELTEQTQQAQGERQQLVERERQLGVLTAELEQRTTLLDAREKRLLEQRKQVEQAASPSFEKLLKAYEGMEPGNAASALHELLPQGRETVIDLLLGMKPRQSAAALDALAAQYPREAADLSREIWARQPQNRPKRPEDAP